VNNEDKIEAAGLKKQEGNALFKLDKYARASKRYEKVLHLSSCSNPYHKNVKFGVLLAYLCFNLKQLKFSCNLNNVLPAN
jgi:FK506-binding protein 4/5